MKLSINLFSLVAIIFSVIAIVALSFTFLPFDKATASAPSGLTATIATTSPALVSATASSIFATSSNCATRVITTYASPIMLTFSDYSAQTPTGTFGHLQLASTTVAYDGGQYGCGLFKAYSFTTQTITVTETR